MEKNFENVFLRLAYSLKDAKLMGKTTIILGAGCSLGATTRDISTQGIMKQCLIEHDYPQSKLDNIGWEDLYRAFVNIVWDGKAQKEQENLLKSKLTGLKPMDGHMCLRVLVEKGYIHNIITTNFDMLLETTFEGLSYRKRVGDGEYKTIGSEPFFNLLKVHGDLDEGAFRFAPHELMSLPPDLHSDISDKTSGPLILAGYRGQDIGLMNALCQDKSYGVYWVSLSFDISDVYENQKIKNFMSNRCSDSNYLHGKEFGNFSILMQKLMEHFIHPSYDKVIKTKEYNLSTEWKNTSIVEMLRIYSRIYELFLDILEITNSIQNELTWDQHNHAYTSNYEEHLNSYLYFFNSKKLPPNLLHIPNNELDALILGVSVEVLVRTIGNDIIPKDFISKVQEKFDDEYNQKIIDNTFWITVEKIVCSEFDIDDAVSINMQNKLALKTFDIPFREFSELLRVVSFLALLVPVNYADYSRVDSKYKVRQLLNGKCEDIILNANSISIDLGKINKTDADALYDYYVNNLPDIHILHNSKNKKDANGKEHIVFKSKWINISLEVEGDRLEEENSSFDLINMAFKQSQKSEAYFLQLGSIYTKEQNSHIELQFDKDIKHFLCSAKAGMFAIGPSGCGKTSALQNLIANEGGDIIFIVVSPKYTKISKTGLSLFLNYEFKDEEEQMILKNLNHQLGIRKAQLLLIFDGLNEINETIENQQIHYCNLISLTDKIYHGGYRNIKILITCREQSYNQYRNATTMLLNYTSFYHNNYDKKMDDASYKIFALSEQEKTSLFDLYISKDIQNKINSIGMKGFWRNSDIMNDSLTPLFIAIAGESFQSFKGAKIIKNSGTVYDLFSNAMLGRLETTDMFLAKKIIFAYFDLTLELRNTNSDVTKFKLLSKLDLKYHPYYKEIIDKMIDINILVRDFSNLERIKFKHDKIEEFFFKDYIEEYDYKGLDFLNSVFLLCAKNIIYQSGALAYLLELERKKQLKKLKDIIVSLFIAHTDFIPKFIVEILACSCNLSHTLNYFLSSVDIAGSKKILSALEWGLEQNLQDYSSVTCDLKKILDELNEISYEMIINDESRAYLYFFESKLKYYNNNYPEAINLAKAAKLLIGEKNQTLQVKIDIHYSVILMELGYSKQCIELLEKDFKSYQDGADLKMMLDVGIELGRALNHSGQTNRTLQLYKQLLAHEDDINDVYILARIYEQKANVLNKRMYHKLHYGRIDKKALTESDLAEIKQLFDDAIILYDKSSELLLRINAIFTYSGVVPEKINTLISYSFSIKEVGVDYCDQMIKEFDYLFHGIKTPFETDYNISKAYFYEYTKKYDLAESCIKTALDYAVKLKIKNKEAKCRHFYAQFLYRRIGRRKQNQKNIIQSGLEQLQEAIKYYEENTIIEDNLFLEDCYILRKSYLTELPCDGI